MFKLYQVRTADRALYADERIYVGAYDSLSDAAMLLGARFAFCEVYTATLH